MKKLILTVAALGCFLSAQAQWTNSAGGGNYSPQRVVIGQDDGNMMLNVTSNNPYGSGIMLANPSTTPAGNWLLVVQGSLSPLPQGFSIHDQRANSPRFMIDGAGNTLMSPYAGNVGIGTFAVSSYKLNVWGRARAHEIVVNTTGADFVFAKDYRLRPLGEVEQFITTHQHLPEIPSAREMQANGMAVGELQTKLLQKVEELTLYVIELKKENQAQQQEIQALKQQVAAPKK
jgi:hypothetical protein